jgi:diacylglycerol kinase (ATP)
VRGAVEAIARHRAVDAAIEVDGRPAWSGRLATAVVANGPCFGGGMRIAPAADPGDGLLDLVVLGDVGRWELLWWLPTVYRGEHAANRKVVSLPATPFTLTVLPGALPLRR